MSLRPHAAKLIGNGSRQQVSSVVSQQPFWLNFQASNGNAGTVYVGIADPNGVAPTLGPAGGATNAVDLAPGQGFLFNFIEYVTRQGNRMYLPDFYFLANTNDVLNVCWVERDSLT